MSIFKTFLKVLISVLRVRLAANYPPCSTRDTAAVPWCSELGHQRLRLP